jgi:hypothetical protein
MGECSISFALLTEMQGTWKLPATGSDSSDITPRLVKTILRGFSNRAVSLARLPAFAGNKALCPKPQPN